MEQEKYLSEEKYQETNKKVNNASKILLTIGIILLVVGVIITITGFVNFNKTRNNMMNSFNNSASNMFDSFNSVMLIGLGGFISVAGFALIIAGGGMTYMAHRREITAYTTQQTMPIKKETINDITPTVADAAGTIAKSVSQGFEEGKKETDDTQNKVD